MDRKVIQLVAAWAGLRHQPRLSLLSSTLRKNPLPPGFLSVLELHRVTEPLGIQGLVSVRDTRGNRQAGDFAELCRGQEHCWLLFSQLFESRLQTSSPSPPTLYFS